MDEALKEMYEELDWIESEIRAHIHAPYKKEFFEEMYARRREVERDIKQYKEEHHGQDQTVCNEDQ